MAVFSEAVAALDLYLRYVKLITNSKIEPLDLRTRKALKTLYFSKSTIHLIESLKVDDTQESMDEIVGKIGITQRDTRREVHECLSELLVIAKDARVSIEIEKLVQDVFHGKASLRSEIASFLFDVATMHNPDRAVVIDNLLVKILDLNSNIEKIDAALGGAILEGSHNG
jgi:hypothetical protein